MASTSQPHSSFPARPFNNLRNPPTTTAFAQSQPALALRQKERLSKDTQAQAPAPAMAPPANAQMNILSDEQREEINEAVCPHTSHEIPCARRHNPIKSRASHQPLLSPHQNNALTNPSVRSLRQRQGPKNRLPRIQSRPQSSRLRSAQT